MTQGIHYPLDYSIQDLSIITSTGQKFNIKKLMISLSYYEDLFAFSSSGSVMVTDANGFIESFQLTGNEFIEIDIGKIQDAVNNTIETFRLYKINKRKPSGSLNSETYELCFCSEEMFLSEQIKISKSYSMQITDIISDILYIQLQVDPNKVNIIEQTDGLYDFVIPRMKPFEAISFLSNYAKSSSSIGCDFLFYQTREGYNFRSLQSIYLDEVYGSYQYSQKNVDYDEEQNEAKQTAVQKFELFKSYDSLNEYAAGTFANQTISIDPLIRSYYVTNFDYAQYGGVKLNKNDPSNYSSYVNRLGVAQNQAYEGVLKVLTTNKDELKAKYISDKPPNSVAHDVYVETYVPYRTAQLSLANYTKIKLTIPGDTGMTVGKVIQFNMNTLKTDSQVREPDKFYSGKYIVTALRHVFTTNQFQTMIEIAKDSSDTQFQGISQSSNFQKALSA